MAVRVLVVDDEPIVTEVVGRYLKLEGCDIRVAGNGIDALAIAEQWDPNLVVLDLMLPGMDGLDVFRQLRSSTNVPVIMLTARGEEADRVVGLELGADDYIVKPFSPRELAARVKSVLRRATNADGKRVDGLLIYGDLVVNPSSREVRIKGIPVELTGKEFDLLRFLASHPNQVFTREQLLNEVWDYAYSAEQGTVTVHVRRLRAKIEADPLRPKYIKTLWGVGYKFEGMVDGPETGR